MCDAYACSLDIVLNYCKSAMVLFSKNFKLSKLPFLLYSFDKGIGHSKKFKIVTQSLRL